MAEITLARMNGDIAALRVAEHYAANDYLKYLPVPRFRVPNIDIDMPVVVRKIVVPQLDNPDEMKKIIMQVKSYTEIRIKEFLSEKRIDLKQEDFRRISAAVNSRCEELSKEMDIDAYMVAKDFSLILAENLRKAEIKIDPQQIAVFQKEFLKQLRSDFVKLPIPQVRLDVLVTSSEVKEAGPDEILTKIHLKIIEEGIQWTSIEVDGTERDQLVIE